MENEVLNDAISDLLAKKKVSMEKEYGPAVPVINQFIESELERLETFSAGNETREVSFELLNELFRAVIDTTW